MLEQGSGKWADFEQVTVASEERTVSKPRKSIRSMCGCARPSRAPRMKPGWGQRESDMAGRNKAQADAWTEDLEGWCDL